MAFEIPGQSITLKAPSTAFSLSQYRFVVASSSEGFFEAGSSVAFVYPVGILQNSPTVAGEACQIMVNGVSKFKTNASLNPGVHIISGANGIAISTGTMARGDAVYGPVLTATAGSSNLGTVVLDKFVYTTS